MISLYPLLVSNTISKNVVPGVCKVLENYIMVYGLTDMLKRIRTSPRSGGDWRIVNKKLIKRENVEIDLPEFLYDEIIHEASKIYDVTGPGNKPTIKSPEMWEKEEKKKDTSRDDAFEYNEKLKDAERMAAAKERGKLSTKPDEGKDSTVRLDAFNTQTISLEPTWMKIDQVDKKGNKMTGVIGVKVVPYAVKSDATLAQLLMYDKQINLIQRLAILSGRRFTNMLYRIWMKAWTKVPFVSASTTVTGDPRKDILLKRNMMNIDSVQDIFVLANQAELSDTFYSSAKEMMKLQKMGWGSIVIADDVNRRVAFCMKELKGLCSMIPYTMLYHTFAQAKVYEDIEDAKRNASSIFKVKREKMTKLIGESISKEKIEKFTNDVIPMFENETISELKFLDENIASFAKKMNPMKLKNIITNISNGNVRNIPKVSNDKIVKYGTKLNPEFRKGYDLAYKVISNSSPDISAKVSSISATAVCIRAALTSPSNFMTGVKDGIKLLIKLFRKLKPKPDSNKPTMPKPHLLDAIFGWIAMLLVLIPVLSSLPFAPDIFSIKKYAKSTLNWLFELHPEIIKNNAVEVIDTAVGASKTWVEASSPFIIVGVVIMGILWNMLKPGARR